MSGNCAQGTHPEAGIAEQSLVVERHDHDGVRAGLAVRVADPAEPPLHGVAEPLERGREQRSVLEAIAAPPTTDELRLHGLESDSRVLFEQHVDVVERERPHVRLEQLVERRTRRCVTARYANAREVRVEVEQIDLPRMLSHRKVDVT